MPVIRSKIDTKSDAFGVNARRMRELLSEVQRLEQMVIAESESKRDKFEARGQLLPRERVARLLDRGSPFLELSRLAGLNMHDDDGKKSVLGGGSIVGIGVMAGKRCLISASDSAVKGGTVAPMGLRKALRAQEIARENKLPVIYLVESGGANLMYQSEIFIEGGRSFANQAQMSAEGLPQIAVVHGSSTAGGAYLPGLSDYVILVRGHSNIFLAGPSLVKAAIGEDCTEDELGGVEIHAQVTGLGEYLCEDDAHAIGMARGVLDKLKWDLAPPGASCVEPLYDEQDLMGLVPAGGGSDVAALKTTAKKDGDDYLVNGSKMWITNGMQADWCCLLANTSEGSVHKNKSLIMVRLDSPGVTRQKIHKIGMDSSDTAQLFFDNVRVPLRNLIGQEGMGFMFQMLQFQEERLYGAAGCLRSLDRLIDQTIDYTRQRQTFGKPILHNQVVHFRLAELRTEVEALRALTYRAVESYISGKDVTRLASMAKLKAGRLSREVADSCLQYWGGMGYTWDNPIAQAYRDSRLISIGGGADEIMLGIICKLEGTLPGKGQ